MATPGYSPKCNQQILPFPCFCNGGSNALGISQTPRVGTGEVKEVTGEKALWVFKQTQLACTYPAQFCILEAKSMLVT